MELKLLAYTHLPKDSGKFNLEESLNFCAKMAGICYMAGDFNSILNESDEATSKRLNQTLNSGHHSVFDHVKLTFELKNISKIIAMTLNNEKDYSTSEKSARYTHSENIDDSSSTLYDKWYNKLWPVIKDTYPQMYNQKLKDPDLPYKKLAQENARYFVSIFSRTTTMGHTLSLRQLNYVLFMMEEFIKNHDKQNEFYCKVSKEFEEFVPLFKEYRVEKLIPIGKQRKLSLFGDENYRNIDDIFSYVYQTSFKASFACVAQNHRHRSEASSIYLLDNYEFVIPDIIKENKSLKDEWLEDANKVKGSFPQGQLVQVNQTGTLDTLFLKCTERLCGNAQLEIMHVTLNTVNKFTNNSPYGYVLKEKLNGETARCRFKDSAKCTRPCIFAKNQCLRKI